MVGSHRTGSTKVWPDERGDYNRAALNAYPDFLNAAERVRLERIRQARMLFDGQHEQFYLTERRSRFAYRQIRGLDGNINTLYVPCNALKLVSLKAADLLMGEIPLITSDMPQHGEMMDKLADRSCIHQVLYQAAVDASSEADTFIEAVVFDGEVYLQQVASDEVFPVGKVMPDGQHRAYIRRTIDIAPGRSIAKPIHLLLEATYTPGSIERHCYQLDERGKKTHKVALDNWPAFKRRIAASAAKAADPIAAIQKTGAAENTMVWLPNLLLRGRPVSDYDGGVIGLQDALNAKNSQLAVVLLKHTQPKLLLPEAQGANGETARHSDEVFYAREGDAKPEYLTWDAQLDAAQKDRMFALNQILVQTETSPVLLGLKEGAAPDAYRKVRLESFNSLTKAQRRSVYWTKALRRALTVASQLEQTIPGQRYQLGEIGVTLRDGIPTDSVDEATELATLRSAGLLSTRRGLEQLIGDPAAVDAEQAELERERSAATPSVLFNNNDGGTDE